MRDDLDILAKKAYALDAMVKRGDLTLKDASEIMEAERGPWIERLTTEVLGPIDRLPPLNKGKKS